MQNIIGAGLGFRKESINELEIQLPKQINFFEIAPENIMQIGGKRRKTFEFFRERYPFICHGLSLSLGGPTPLDEDFLIQIKHFLNDYEIPIYSEHLSYCSDEGQLYDLLPIPFTEEAIHYVANRIKRTQEILERPIAVENVSYYCAPGQQLSELEFINGVLHESGCELLLDVNNVYVNSINHGYDANQFLLGLKPNKIAYIHVAGHHQEKDDLAIDTHGASIIRPVWELLSLSYQHFGVLPTLLERDFNIPPLAKLLQEIDEIKLLQNHMEQREHKYA